MIQYISIFLNFALEQDEIEFVFGFNSCYDEYVSKALLHKHSGSGEYE